MGLKMTYGGRFKLFRKFKKLTQSELASLLKFTTNVGISNIENNKAELSSQKLLLLISHFPEINTNWLLTGEGNMILNKQDQQKEFENLKVMMEFEENAKKFEVLVEKINNGELTLSEKQVKYLDTIIQLQEEVFKVDDENGGDLTDPDES